MYVTILSITAYNLTVDVALELQLPEHPFFRQEFGRYKGGR